MTLPERFESRIARMPDGCWIWTGALHTAGYGMVHRNVRAHRAIYEILVGPIPDGLELDHLCRVRSCVNPAHVEPVTHAENCRRGRAGWRDREKTHCIHGHEFTPENTIAHGRDGRHRKCRTCSNAAGRALRRRQKEMSHV